MVAGDIGQLEARLPGGETIVKVDAVVGSSE